MSDHDIEQRVLDALGDARFRWRTVGGVASQLNVPEQKVREVISERTDQVLRSSVLSTDGSELYTTRSHFIETSTAYEKLIGAFKGKLG
ncbi:hypothetical protein MCEMSE15_02768 [Fimbriimonadaceae bacterium]